MTQQLDERKVQPERPRPHWSGTIENRRRFLLVCPQDLDRNSLVIPAVGCEAQQSIFDPIWYKGEPFLSRPQRSGIRHKL